ncbi:glycoside hydrolase family 19 protein [Pandoraea apista]|uniref:glycoside hydrolase family 19 protein n=1 Tax=Pandoraea apista TaxID=93218 RepID=UPI001C62A42F|nr:glycoside hydrolase family 19 protein [Pandoraea apista]
MTSFTASTLNSLLNRLLLLIYHLRSHCPPYLGVHETRSSRDLGNAVKGDGSEYRGRRLIQITGRANYMACDEALGLDLINQPALLEQPPHAAMSAAWSWSWSTRGLNTLADQGNFVKITRRINGGLTGQDDRQALYEKALKVLT